MIVQADIEGSDTIAPPIRASGVLVLVLFTEGPLCSQAYLSSGQFHRPSMND